MADCNVTQKKIEDDIFDFVDEIIKGLGFSSNSRISYYNEIVDFVENKIVPFFYNEDVEDLYDENCDLEDAFVSCKYAFENFQSDVIDCLEEIESAIDEVDADSIDSMTNFFDNIPNLISKKKKEFDIEIDY